MNQGRGIEIFKTAKEITDFVFGKKDSLCVVQKYIERPLLYKQRKFDIRVWALVTEDFRIYYYREGYLRTSSTDYDTKIASNQVHLTN